MDAKLIRGIAILVGDPGRPRRRDRQAVDRRLRRRPPAPARPPRQAPAGAIVVSVAYSPEKEALFKQAFAAFNARKVTVDGRPVFAQGQNVASGAALDALRAGTLKPVIWTPSSSLWGRLLTQTADVTWVPRQNVSLFRTPLVIAMWEEQARALGWPQKQLGWADILAEAKNTQGWAKYGHPEWGPFRLGQTNPDFSTSGLSAVAAEYYAAAGKTEGLTMADVENPAVRGAVRDIQSSVVHYGDTTLFFAEQLAKRGPAFASAVAMEETTLVDYNARLRKNGKRLVAIYPKEGTFFSDDPLMVLDAPWVTPAQKAGAAKLVAYLSTPEVQSKVMAAGFRPADSSIPLSGNLTAANGVDASSRSASCRCPSRRCSPACASCGTRTASRPTSCSCVDTSGLDGRRGQARPGAAGARPVPDAAVAARPGRARRVQRPVDAGAAAGRDAAAGPPGDAAVGRRPVRRRRHRGLRRDAGRARPAPEAGRPEAHRGGGRAHGRRGQQVDRRRRARASSA